MLRKNITFAISVVFVFIISIIISSTYYKWQTPNYSDLMEYESSDKIDISENVKIENIDYLYYMVEGRG